MQTRGIADSTEGCEMMIRVWQIEARCEGGLKRCGVTDPASLGAAFEMISQVGFAGRLTNECHTDHGTESLARRYQHQHLVYAFKYALLRFQLFQSILPVAALSKRKCLNPSSKPQPPRFSAAAMSHASAASSTSLHDAA
jgi:hypothetical protein